ncbi:SDR family NAD(P)-dependent oxidoreductase [Hymenobacter sediminis]|uniref:SDR family oxidoreductase n=1 Tax=Hymenobacter sediminis TaxID=2218621 RepID=UPI000DA6836B|nr:SDR family NAD(P)-dependent oxidoreductase [Hymenobacter sediminis]RPD44328.1 SDR family NAD(P)-dependent oxidoreductase [Hymenobacter sediminis]
MNISNKTILVTGGGSGIGLATAQLLLEKGNRLLITGRSEARLQQAVAQLPGVTAIASDLTDAASVAALVRRLEAEFSDLSVLINNAGHGNVYQLGVGADAATKAGEEMAANYLGTIRLTELLLPLLTRQPEAAIVNVTSIVVFAPAAVMPTYAASKAALHSYTQSLRHTLAQTTQVKVFELFPPLVNTDFTTKVGGENGIPPRQVATELVAGLEQDITEILVGQTAQFYELHRAAPAEAFAAMNQG